MATRAGQQPGQEHPTIPADKSPQAGSESQTASPRQVQSGLPWHIAGVRTQRVTVPDMKPKMAQT